MPIGQDNRQALNRPNGGVRSRQDTGSLVLIGGDSRAAAAIGARNTARRTILVTRRDGPGERVKVSDYRTVPPELDLTDATIVNCAGTDRADWQVLQALNVEVPLAWARAAGSRGARQFIQLSSFSVYGRCEAISRDTRTAPASDYGKSKRDAEEALFALAPDCPVSVLRVPILVSPAGANGPADKLGQLAHLTARLRAVPAPARGVLRSMISYDGMARAVALLEDEPLQLAIAADPEPFTYDLLAQCARNGGRGVLSVPVPGIATAALARIAPGLSDRLFASSLLTDDANLLTGHEDFQRLRAIVASHFAS